ncbi:hypothetical protein GOP47_0031076 [Adiantum capillus-veneris]|nr:hypothetical protein GOP47_0031076 [Adiantum capillus-veneris]
MAHVELRVYVLKCKLRDQTSSYTRKFKKAEDMPGYEHIDVENWRTSLVLKDQPEWRLEYFKKHKDAIKEYAKAPREMRIYPTFFFLTPRR